jgi:hypothetical protein
VADAGRNPGIEPDKLSEAIQKGDRLRQDKRKKQKMISVVITLNQSEGRLLADLLEAAVLMSEKAKGNLYDRISFGVVCELYQKLIGKLRTISPGNTARVRLSEPRALALMAVLMALESLAPLGPNHRELSNSIISIIHQKTT